MDVGSTTSSPASHIIASCSVHKKKEKCVGWFRSWKGFPQLKVCIFFRYISTHAYAVEEVTIVGVYVVVVVVLIVIFVVIW